MFLENVNRKSERRRLSVMGWGPVAFVASTYAIIYCIAYILRALGSPLALGKVEIQAIGYAVQYLVGAPLCAFIITRIPSDPMEKYTISSERWMRLFAACACLMMMGALVGNAFNSFLAQIPGIEPVNPLPMEEEPAILILTCVLSVLAAPVVEEWIFRKLLLDRVNRYGDFAAMVLSGTMFGLFHGNFYQFFYAFLVGCLFAYVYLRTGRISYTISLHMACNFVFGCVSQIIYVVSEGEDLIVLAGVYALLEFALAAVGFLCLIKEFHEHPMLKGWLDLSRRDFLRILCTAPGILIFFVVCIFQFSMNLIGFGG